jgi:WD40 repeat protein/serine/threonine protein kinase
MPARPSADRTLLYGILALQMDFIGRDALIRAMHAWVLDKARPLGQILVEQGALSADRHALLDAVVQEHLKQHGGDAEQSLAALRPVAAVQADLRRLADPDLDASLAHVAGSDPAEVGTQLTGDYRSVGMPTSSGQRFTLLRPHAQGGLGEVFVALDEELHREVALKQIQERHADHAESRARFVREAEITGGLEHPGVVPIYGLGQYADGRPFYAMRFIRGQSLKEASDRFHQAGAAGADPGTRALGLRQLLDRFLAVCNAVAYAHSRGVLHRDLKPANVMLGPYGETLVVDWGLARLIGRPEGLPATGEPPLHVAAAGDSDLTQMGRALGTPAYMSPEQAAGRLDQLGVASDVYSLGATLYYLLTGRAAFRESDPGLLLYQVQQGEFPPPRQVNRDVPPALEAICLKAMALRPEQRYASARALADDVERWLADERVTAYAESWRARLGRWVRRHKPLVASAAGVASVGLTVAVATMLLTAAAAREVREQQLRSFAEEERTEADKQRSRAEQQEALVRRYLYFSRISQADRAWHENQMVRMEELLQGQRPEETGGEDLLGFEWHYLWRLRHSWLGSLQGHTAGVVSVAFSPDGRRLASGSWDRTIKVWEAKAGKELLTIKDAHGPVAFSPDGTRLASASQGRTVQVWDAATGQLTLTLKGHTGVVQSVAFSPDGKRLASGGEHLVGDRDGPGELKVWDVATGQKVLSVQGQTGGVTSVCFSPDGTRLASASVDLVDPIRRPSAVKVWDAATGLEVRSLKGHIYTVYAVCYSPDGQRLASANGDGKVKVWDVATGREVLTLVGHAGLVYGVCYSPDGRRLASASTDRTVRVWDAASGQVVRTLKGHTESVKGVAFSPDGQQLASASEDRTVKVWDATTDQDALSLQEHRGGFLSVACSPDGRRLASTSGDNAVEVWDTTTGQQTLTLKGHAGLVVGVAFSPDGRHLASASWDKTVRVWNAGTGQETLTLKGHAGWVHSVAFSPDGQRLATGSAGPEFHKPGEIRIWDVQTGREALFLNGHTAEVSGVAFSPDGRWLASASFDRTVKVWDAATGREHFSLQGHSANVTSVCFSPDGRRLASASGDRTVRVWDSLTGRMVLTLTGHTDEDRSVAFTPDGHRLASASKDQTVKVWDTTTGEEALTLQGHTSVVTGVAFSPDGRRLVSSSIDGTVKVWDASGTSEATSPKK